MITSEVVKHIARLARIELTEAETVKFQKDISEILDFVKRLGEVDVSGVPAMAGGLAKEAPEKLENEARQDEIVSPLGNPAELVNAAPKKKNGWVEVKAVF